MLFYWKQSGEQFQKDGIELEHSLCLLAVCQLDTFDEDCPVVLALEVLLQCHPPIVWARIPCSPIAQQYVPKSRTMTLRQHLCHASLLSATLMMLGKTVILSSSLKVQIQKCSCNAVPPLPPIHWPRPSVHPSPNIVCPN